MVLVGHYRHLVKMDLWYVRVRGGVDVFGGTKVKMMVAADAERALET